MYVNNDHNNIIKFIYIRVRMSPQYLVLSEEKECDQDRKEDRKRVNGISSSVQQTKNNNK